MNNYFIFVLAVLVIYLIYNTLIDNFGLNTCDMFDRSSESQCINWGSGNPNFNYFKGDKGYGCRYNGVQCMPDSLFTMKVIIDEIPDKRSGYLYLYTTDPGQNNWENRCTILYNGKGGGKKTTVIGQYTTKAYVTSIKWGNIKPVTPKYIMDFYTNKGIINMSWDTTPEGVVGPRSGTTPFPYIIR